MEKKILIFVLSVLTVIFMAIGGIVAVLFNLYAPKDPSENYTGIIIPEEADEVEEKEETEKIKNTEPIEITQIYNFQNEFKTREFKQDIYKDEKSRATMPYCVFEPLDYSADKSYPVLLYLHGAGEKGRDNVSQTIVMKEAFIVNGDLLKDVLIVCPQTTSWWDAHRAIGDGKGPVGASVRLIDFLSNTYNIDRNRIYIMGISMGGYGTWNGLSAFPDTFAAGIPICGGGNTSFADILSDIPIWVYHGTDDSVVPFLESENMYNAIKAAGGNKINFTRLEGVDHNCWSNAMMNRELFSWLLSQNKATNKNGDYSIIPNFKIIDEAGNTIITDEDTENPYFHYSDEVKVRVQFTFTDEGFEKIKSAYKKGGEFTLYHGSQKLFSFTPTDIEPTKNFEVEAQYTK